MICREVPKEKNKKHNRSHPVVQDLSLLEQQRLEQLKHLGRCTLGYESWVKEEGGYRCGGGTHFVSNEDLDAASLKNKK